MKIGAFAQRYQLNPSTVRYYIDQALLTPKRENGQYRFDQVCMEQMERIIRYKSCGFSLEEIALLNYYESATNLRDRAVLEKILQMLREKTAAVEAEIADREEILARLEAESAHFLARADAEPREQVPAVPLEILGLAACPVCQTPLSLRDADIEAGGIVRGLLCCPCGYRAEVEQGLIRCEGASEETPFRTFENIDPVLAATDDYSPAFRMLIEKAQLWMYQQLIAAGGIPTALAGPFSRDFLLKYMRVLPEETLYLITDVSLRKLEKLRTCFSGTDRRIVYMAGAPGKLPLRRNSVALYIDDFSSNNYIFTYSQGLLDTVGRFLVPGGRILGQFADYARTPGSLENIRRDHGGFDPRLTGAPSFFHSFPAAHMKLLEKHNLGTPPGSQRDFTWQADGEKVALFVYRGKRRRRGQGPGDPGGPPHPIAIHENPAKSSAVRESHGFVVVLGGRQPACVLRLALQSPSSLPFSA